MISVNENHHASCDACGLRPDALSVGLKSYDVLFTLCGDCGMKLLKAVAKHMAAASPKWKRQIDELFKGNEAKAKRSKSGVTMRTNRDGSIVVQSHGPDGPDLRDVMPELLGGASGNRRRT